MKGTNTGSTVKKKTGSEKMYLTEQKLPSLGKLKPNSTR